FARLEYRGPGEGDREHPCSAGEEGQRHLADARHQVADGACHAGSALRAQAPRLSGRACGARGWPHTQCVEYLAARASARLRRAREMLACVLGQSSATWFPPPLWGRDRERGATRTAFPLSLRLNKFSPDVV